MSARPRITVSSLGTIVEHNPWGTNYHDPSSGVYRIGMGNHVWISHIDEYGQERALAPGEYVLMPVDEYERMVESK